MIDHLDASPSETVRRHAATFRKVRQARIDAVEASRGELSDQIVIEVAAREAGEDEAPRAAWRLARSAKDAGWTTAVVYSRTAAGVDAVSVRCRRPGESAVGYWRSGKFAFGLATSFPMGTRRFGARQLKALIETPLD